MTINFLFGLSGFSGLITAFIVCLSLIVLSIVLHKQKSSNLIKIFYILIYAQTILLGLALLSLNFLIQRNAFEYSVVFNSIESAMTWIDKPLSQTNIRDVTDPQLNLP